MDTKKNRKTLVYSCSGCSSAAQMANAIALSIDRQGAGEMSCITAIGGGVEPFVSDAKAAGLVVAIDGCGLHCAGQCLKKEGIDSFLHYDLSRYGVKQNLHSDFSAPEAEAIQAEIVQDLKIQSAKPMIYGRRAAMYAI